MIFVNNMQFLITMSCGIKIVNVQYILILTAKQLSKKLKIIMKLYSRGSNIVQTILMDMEFDSIKDELMVKIVVNTLVEKYHVAEIEICINTVKERCRAMASGLPFNFLHKLIVANLV